MLSSLSRMEDARMGLRGFLQRASHLRVRGCKIWQRINTSTRGTYVDKGDLSKFCPQRSGLPLPTLAACNGVRIKFVSRGLV
jgi:hypothetical protein